MASLDAPDAALRSQRLGLVCSDSEDLIPGTSTSPTYSTVVSQANHLCIRRGPCPQIVPLHPTSPYSV